MDLLVTSRDTILARLFNTPPAGYRVRITVLGALWAIVFLQSFTFLVVWFKDRKQRGRSLKLFSIQKTANGSLLSVQALCIYEIIICVQSLVATVRQGLLYSRYYRGGNRYVDFPLYTITLTGSALAGFVLVFSNLNAAILLFGNRARSMTFQRLWIPVYNAFFVILPLMWLGSAFTLGTHIYRAEKVLYDSAKEALPMLESAIVDPTSITPTILLRLQVLQERILSNLSTNISQRKLFLILDVVYCSIYTVAEVAGIPLIIILRRSIRTNQSLLQISRAMHVPTRGNEDAAGATKTQLSAGVVISSPQESNLSLGTTVRTQGSEPAAAGRTDRDPDELQRLLSNLLVFVPLSFTLSLYCITALGILYVNGTKEGWQWEEFSTDILSWPWTTHQVVLLACFNYSLWKESSRQGSPHASAASRSKNSTRQREALNGHYNIQLENVYPPLPNDDGEKQTAEKWEVYRGAA